MESSYWNLSSVAGLSLDDKTEECYPTVNVDEEEGKCSTEALQTILHSQVESSIINQLDGL
ncbi:MAG: hypothetical protein WCE81_11960 [Halobacteriota archaeon]